jgi:major membrane immunogen (membrane-anchored lipoprotein)
VLEAARKAILGYDVDEISGATVSSNNWKIAAKRALEKASK